MPNWRKGVQGPQRKYVRKTTKSRVAKVEKKVNELKKFVDMTIENKQINLEQASIPITDLVVYRRGFFGIQPGAQDGNAFNATARIGNSITLLHQRFVFECARNGNSMNRLPQRVRILLVESKEGNQDLSLEDVLHYYQDQAGAASGGNIETYTTKYTTRTDTNKLYKIHMDRTLYLNQYDRPIQKFKCNIKYGKIGKVVEFNDNASAPTNHRLSLMMVSDAQQSADYPDLTYSVRTTYKDA